MTSIVRVGRKGKGRRPATGAVAASEAALVLKEATNMGQNSTKAFSWRYTLRSAANRRAWTFAISAFGIGFAVGCGFLPGCAENPGEGTLTAQRFVVVDEQGRKRAVFGMFKERPFDVGLAILDASQRERVLVTLEKDNTPGIELRHENIMRLALTLFPDGSPVLSLVDKEDNSRLLLAVLPEGFPGLFLSDEEHVRGQLRLDRGNRPSLEFKDPKGTTVWSAP